MKIQTRHLILTILLTIAILTAQPIVTKADQIQTGTVTITALGQANPMGNETTQSPASVNMSLTGTVISYEGGHTQFQNLTGSLNIGSENYTISNGLGEVGDQGEVQIDANANTNGTEFELELHGTMQGNSLIFNSPDSKLDPLYTLVLTGQVTTTTQTAVVTQPQTESETQSQYTTATNSSDPSTQVQTISSFENATTSETVSSPTSSVITTTVANKTTSTTSNDLVFSPTTNRTIPTQATSTVTTETLQSTNSTLVTSTTTTDTGTNQTLTTTALSNSAIIQPTVTTPHRPTNSTRSDRDAPASLED